MNAPDAKAEVINRILANDTYTPESTCRVRVAASLAKLSLQDLRDMELILTFRVAEAHDVCRKLDGKPCATANQELTQEELTERFYLVRGQRDRLLWACEKALAAYDLAHATGKGSWGGEDVDKMRAAVAECKPMTLKEAVEKARGSQPPTPLQGFA